MARGRRLHHHHHHRRPLALLLVPAIALVICPFLVDVASAGIIRGKYRGSETWRYLTRFCFVPRSEGDDKGVIEATFSYANKTASQLSINLYYLSSYGGGGAEDEWGAWSKVYDREHTCGEKVAEAMKMGNRFLLTVPSTKVIVGSVEEDIPSLPIDGDPANFRSDEYEETHPDKMPANSFQFSYFKTSLHTSRNRWFFITISNCAEEGQCTSPPWCDASLDVSYAIILTNGKGRNKYFSADESGVLQITYVFAALYSIVGLYGYIVSQRLRAGRKFHSTVKLLMWSVGFALIAVVVALAYYTQYASYGEAPSWLRYLSLGFSGAAEIMMMLQMMLVAKGWTIVRRKISAQGRLRLSVFVTFYASVYCVAVVFYEYYMETVSITYLYETVPGYMIVFLRLVLFAWVFRAIRITLSKYNKKGFYFKFGFAVCLWALIVPFLVVLNLLVDPWVRYKVIYFASLFFNWWAHAVLVAMYDPNLTLSAAFPFHSTTLIHGNKSQRDAFDAIQFAKANAISRKVTSGVSMVTMLSRDMKEFLDDAHDAFQQRMLEAKGRDETAHGSGSGVEMTGRASTLPSDALTPLKERSQGRLSRAAPKEKEDGRSEEQEVETFPRVPAKGSFISKIAKLKASSAAVVQESDASDDEDDAPINKKKLQVT